MSSRNQPSGLSPVSTLFIQGVMASLAWSICTRPLQLFVVPSPRSLASILPNEVRSSIWRRWAEFWEFDVQTPDAESVSPPLAIFEAHERAAPLSAHQASLTAPPTTKRRRRRFVASASSVYARWPRETATIVRPEARRKPTINNVIFFSTLNVSFSIEPSVHPTILLLHKTH